MARSRFGVVRGSALRQGQRRKTTWAASADISTTTNLAANAVVLHQSFTEGILQAGGLLPSTIMRVRGELWVKSDQLAAVRVPFGALGFAVVSEQARVAGVASVPTPITDEGSDMFFVHQFWAANFDIISTGVGSLGSEALARYSFDSKAMRKISTGQAIVVTLENAAAAGGVDFVLKFRILFKIH